MDNATLQSQIDLGEDSKRQFKRDVTNADALAAEMAAFSNSEGGVIYLGVETAGFAPAGMTMLVNQFAITAAAVDGNSSHQNALVQKMFSLKPQAILSNSSNSRPKKHQLSSYYENIAPLYVLSPTA